MINDTSKSSSSWLVCFIVAFALGCGDDGDDGSIDGGNSDSATGQLQWYETCGDPACGGYTPTPGATICSTETVGDSCSPRDTSCEIADNACNVDLVCTDVDPTSMTCPISRRPLKRDIRYLSPAQRDRLARALLDTRLATYRYRDPAGDQTSKLGFIIDDQPDSPAVRGDGQRVDLYGYTSMAVAAIQTQAETIARLEHQVAELRAEIGQLRASKSENQPESQCGN